MAVDNYFMSNLHESYVTELGCELATPGQKSGYKSDPLSAIMFAMQKNCGWGGGDILTIIMQQSHVILENP